MQFTTVFSSIAVASSLLVVPVAGQTTTDSSVISSQLSTMKTAVAKAHATTAVTTTTAAVASASASASGTPCTDSEAGNSTASGCVPAKSPVLASGIVVAADVSNAKSAASGSATSTISAAAASVTASSTASPANQAAAPSTSANAAGSTLQLLSAGKPLSMMGLVAAGFALYA